MSFVATAISATAVIGGSLIASSGAKSAAKTAANADTYAADLQNQQYQQTREDYAPWRAAGGSAVTQQANLLGLNGADTQNNAFSQFREDPGYQYAVNQAIQGVDRSAAARGLVTSGATIKAIQDRAYNLADQGYSNYFNRLAGVAGTGQTATGSTASAGQSAAANAGNAIIQGGNAQASGYINSTNAITGGLSGLASVANNGLNNYYAMNGFGNSSALTPPSYTAPSYATNYLYPTGGI